MFGPGGEFDRFTKTVRNKMAEHKGTRKLESKAQKKARVLRSRRGEHVNSAAAAEGIPPTTLRDWRQKAGRDPLYGWHPEDEDENNPLRAASAGRSAA